MIRLQTPDEWRRRTGEMQEALQTIQRCLSSAPRLSLTPGASYRVRLAGNVIQDGKLALERVGEWAEGMGERTIEGVFRGRLPAPASAEGVTVAHGSIVFRLTAPEDVKGKAAVFADMDVLEYEGLGVR